MVHLEDAIRVGRFDNFLRQKQKMSHSYSVVNDKRDDCNTCRGNNDDVNITAETSPMDISNISSISGGGSLAASPNKHSHQNNIIMDEDKKSSQRYDQLFKTFNTEEQQQQQQSPILVTPSKYDSQAEGDSDSRIKIIMEAREAEDVSCQLTATAFIPSCPPPPQMKYEFADDGYSPSLLFEEEYNNDSTEGAVDKPQQRYNAPNNHRASRDSPTFSPPIIPIGRNLSTISDLSGSIKIRKTPPPSPINNKKNNNTMRRESSFASFIDTLYGHLCGNECGIGYVCSASCYGIEKTKEDRMKEAEDTFLGKKICCPRMMPECGYDNDIFVDDEEEENEGNYTTPASASPSKNDMMISSPTTTATNLNKDSLRWL